MYIVLGCVKKHSVLHQLLVLGKSSLEWRAQNKYMYMQFKQNILIANEVAIKHWINTLDAKNSVKNKMDFEVEEKFFFFLTSTII